jgi:lysyl-tRNA synthetase class 2
MRSELLQKTRAFFLDRGFFEVDTPVISDDTIVDRFIEPVPVQMMAGRKSKSGFLQTSPEFAMKRLMACGADKIFQIGKCFRQFELGALHNPEFTMLEWYRVGDNYEQGRALLDEFAQHILDVKPAQQIPYRELFSQIIDVDPLWAADHELQKKCLDFVWTTEAIDDRDNMLNFLLANAIEPELANRDSVIIYDWPASQSALAKLGGEDLVVAERFELYIRGIELANGYHELTDANELQQRTERINDLRIKDGLAALPVYSRLLAAMRGDELSGDELSGGELSGGLPDCCGTALGFDRLAMLALGKKSIAEVIPFEFGRA